jgi:hypothetical protein
MEAIPSRRDVRWVQWGSWRAALFAAGNAVGADILVQVTDAKQAYCYGKTTLCAGFIPCHLLQQESQKTEAPSNATVDKR